ncbi:MAG TPA: PH domain-containing protein [Methylocystis sp.]|nr:PH domain-containing protein [Methylocystis sp.]
MSDGETRVHEFRQHWVTLLGPFLLLLAGLAIFKYGRDFFLSREGRLLLSGLFGTFEPMLGPQGVKTLEEIAEPVVIIFLILVFALPFVSAYVVRATTRLGVDSHQIIWRRGVFARDITQIEIGEIVGVNVSQTLLGRLLNFGDVDVETRGEDRLVMRVMDDARAFAGLVLDYKHSIAGAR